ncbi:expressed protein [Phakopsora pachyrhizi]|uniref:Diphthamide biosynthesis protein 4 n=1 Tax=Phakopsora pachyrhizi TaxID=170000 RepID=A0AAV0B211_PHAPC|nr:expressed protein [Phakopsora pachyrhizi]
MSEDEEDYYEILRVQPTSTESEIRSSFKALVILNHPDKNQLRLIKPSKVEGDDGDDEEDEEKPRLSDLNHQIDLIIPSSSTFTKHPPQPQQLHRDGFINDQQKPELIQSHLITQRLIRAYKTLIDPSKRYHFDQIRKNRLSKRSDIPNGPTTIWNVIDLSEFTELNPQGNSHDDDDQSFYYDCRCGGKFKISYQEMVEDVRIVNCDGCSSRVIVDYQISET